MSKPTTISDYIQESHATAVEKGWWEGKIIREICTCISEAGKEAARFADNCPLCKDTGYKRTRIERSFGDQIALMHSELSEALEEFRSGEPYDDYYVRHPEGDKHYSGDDPFDTLLLRGSKPEGIAVELADVLIRIFDTCGKYNIPLEEALKLKLAYNKTRPHRHGGKAL